MNHKKLLTTIPLIIGFLAPMNAETTEAFARLMPVPSKVMTSEGKYRIDGDFDVSVIGQPDERLYGAASRFVRRLDDRTGLFLKQDFVRATYGGSGSGLLVEVDRPGQIQLGEDESYLLVVSSDKVHLRAPTDLGAMHGLETLLQLVSVDEEGYFFPNGSIEDSPRFPWRGLMIDSARHFMPLDMIKRNLDGMSAMKLNVMHWHLTEDQGFRIESKKYPRLHELGSDGLFYTQEEVKGIIEYAAERGIRVYPEFDVPGHATSWLVGHPELGSAPGPYTIERAWGIFDPTLDPTNQQVYEVLDGLFGEMAALFPDAYFHIGGDEVTGKHWENNPRIAAFMKERDMHGLHDLQNYFNHRVLEILTQHGKIMVGWDEILQPDMPTNIVIHSWRGRDSMESAAKRGFRSILSNGYYIDLLHPAKDHYLNDPLPADIDLNDAEKKGILGGEATMWSEHVTVETVDSRIWPRTAAIAERFWSSSTVTDVEDLYRRLDIISIQLEELGLTHLKNREMMMRRLARGYAYDALRILADVVEPLKGYKRNAKNRYRSFSPYTLLPDVAVADAKDARKFRNLSADFLSGEREDLIVEIRLMLEQWRSNHEAFADLAAGSPALREGVPLAKALAELSDAALVALDSGKQPEGLDGLLEEARQSHARVELQVVDAIEALINAAVKK